MKTKHKELKAVDAEYAAALSDYQKAKKALRKVAAEREAAHLAVEFAASRAGQKALAMTDAEWEAHKQRIEAARGPKVEPVVSAPGAK